MDKQETLTWALKKCSELVDRYLIANNADWHNIDQPALINAWNESDGMFTLILCMRKTGSDIIMLDTNRQTDKVMDDINNYIIKRNNEKFYVINPFFKKIDKVSSLEAFSWSMYVFKSKYHSIQFESDRAIKILY